jgi:hypothetical protein
MASFAPKGHARLDPQRPQAFAICDRCGFMYRHCDLQWDTQYHGRQIRRTGFLVCASCNDVPNPTLRPIVLPPDPVPILNPRPEPIHCHVFKPRADVLRPSFPTADTSNRMFPPVDMWRDVTVDSGSTCDTRSYKDGWSVPRPPIPPILPEPPIEPPDATTDNTNATADTTGTTADSSPIFPAVLTDLNTADTTLVLADDSHKLVNVFPDYLYAADMDTVKGDDTVTVQADSQTD